MDTRVTGLGPYIAALEDAIVYAIFENFAAKELSTVSKVVLCCCCAGIGKKRERDNVNDA